LKSADFELVTSLLVMSLGLRLFCISRKDGTQGGGWVGALKGCKPAWLLLSLAVESPSLTLGGPLSSFARMGLDNSLLVWAIIDRESWLLGTC